MARRSSRLNVTFEQKQEALLNDASRPGAVIPADVGMTTRNSAVDWRSYRRLVPLIPRTSNNADANDSTRKRGALANLPHMPLDVLFEVRRVILIVCPFFLMEKQIFGHLLPRDLIRLACTSKAFRKTMLSPQNVNIWITALKQVPGGVPERPPDISEPRWVDFLFGENYCRVRLQGAI